MDCLHTVYIEIKRAVGDTARAIILMCFNTMPLTIVQRLGGQIRVIVAGYIRCAIGAGHRRGMVDEGTHFISGILVEPDHARGPSIATSEEKLGVFRPEREVVPPGILPRPNIAT